MRDKCRRREGRGVARRTLRGGLNRWVVRQTKEWRKDRSNGKVSERWEVKDRGGRKDSRSRGKMEKGGTGGINGKKGRRAGRGRSGMERGDPLKCLRTEGECRRSEKFWSFYSHHSSQEI